MIEVKYTQYTFIMDEANLALKGSCRVQKEMIDGKKIYTVNNLTMFNKNTRLYQIHGIGYTNCNKNISTPQGVKCYHNNEFLGFSHELPNEYFGKLCKID